MRPSHRLGSALFAICIVCGFWLPRNPGEKIRTEVKICLPYHPLQFTAKRLLSCERPLPPGSVCHKLIFSQIVSFCEVEKIRCWMLKKGSVSAWSALHVSRAALIETLAQIRWQKAAESVCGAKSTAAKFPVMCVEVEPRYYIIRTRTEGEFRARRRILKVPFNESGSSRANLIIHAIQAAAATWLTLFHPPAHKFCLQRRKLLFQVCCWPLYFQMECLFSCLSLFYLVRAALKLNSAEQRRSCTVAVNRQSGWEWKL